MALIIWNDLCTDFVFKLVVLFTWLAHETEGFIQTSQNLPYYCTTYTRIMTIVGHLLPATCRDSRHSPPPGQASMRTLFWRRSCSKRRTRRSSPSRSSDTGRHLYMTATKLANFLPVFHTTTIRKIWAIWLTVYVICACHSDLRTVAARSFCSSYRRKAMASITTS